MLVELRLDEAKGQPGRPDLGDAHVAEEKRQSARVIFVPVSDDDCADVLLVVAQVTEIGQHEVDAEMLVPWEGQPRVDDDDPLVGLDDHHVLPHFAEAAERDQSGRSGHSAQCSRLAPWQPRPESAPPCSA
jgi:hypothetical protein